MPKKVKLKDHKIYVLSEELIVLSSNSKCCHASQVYKCHICGKVSTSGSKFKLHKISVHEGFSTSCGPCGVVLKYRGIMKMQESRIHRTAEDFKEVIDNTIEVPRFKEFHGSNSCTF